MYLNKLTHEIIQQLLKEAYADNKHIIAIYSGRFQPWAKHHKLVYDYIKSLYPDTYVVTTNKTDSNKSPLNFEEKKQIISASGVPSDKIKFTKHPYQIFLQGSNNQKYMSGWDELLNKYDKKNTVIIFFIGEKDAARFKETKNSHLLNYDKVIQSNKQLKNYYKNVYYRIIPNIKSGEKILSATEIRNILSSNLPIKQKKVFFKNVMGFYNEKIFNMLVNKLNNNKILKEGYDFVTCKLCNKKMKQIQYLHLKYSHNTTLNEYIKKFPTAKLVSESAKNYGDKNSMNIPGVREHHKKIIQEKMQLPDVRKKISENTKGKKHNNMSGDNNPSKRLDVRKKISESVKKSYTPELLKTRAEALKKIVTSKKYRENMENLGIWTPLNKLNEKEKYYREVKSLSKINYLKYIDEIDKDRIRDRNNHLDHKYSIFSGFNNNIPVELVAHYKNLEIIPGRLNESKNSKNSIELNELINLIENSKDKISKKILLTCGGAFGHMQHVYEDKDLTFGDFKNIIIKSLNGQLSNDVIEKVDGQNLMISWISGEIRFARSTSQLKNFGKTSLGINEIKSKFEGRGDLSDAFLFAADDLNNAISSLTNAQKYKVFANGKRWMNLEILWPATTNIIPYNMKMIIFHNFREYDIDGNIITGDFHESARMLTGMIKQINKNIQNNFTISSLPLIKLPKIKDFSQKKDYFLDKLKDIQNKYNLLDGDKLQKYFIKFWTELFKTKAEEFNYNIPNTILKDLINRFALDNKSKNLKILKLEIKNAEFLNWLLNFINANEADKFKKENMKPLENLFIELSVEVLSNISIFLSPNRTNFVQQIKNKIDDIKNELINTHDLKKLEKFKIELNKIETIGGFDKIIPAEGIVFSYTPIGKDNPKLYKYTGLFGPINQILGIIKYSRT